MEFVQPNEVVFDSSSAEKLLSFIDLEALIKIYEEGFFELEETINLVKEARSPVEIRNLYHKMKGVTRTLGLVLMGDFCYYCEYNSLTMDFSTMKQQGIELEKLLQITIHFVHEFFDAINDKRK